MLRYCWQTSVMKNVNHMLLYNCIWGHWFGLLHTRKLQHNRGRDTCTVYDVVTWKRFFFFFFFLGGGGGGVVGKIHLVCTRCCFVLLVCVCVYVCLRASVRACACVCVLALQVDSCDVLAHILQGCFTGTGAIIKCQWRNPEGYGKIDCHRSKTKQSKTKPQVFP